MRRIVTRIISCLLLICIVSTACARDRYQEVFDTSGDTGNLTARFLAMTTNTGEKSGDATILTSPDGKVMLIDVGDPGAGGQVVAALQAMGVARIDYLIASHPHIDHIGGFPAVMRAFAIGQVMTSYVEYPSPYADAYMAEIAEQGIEHVLLKQGDMFTFGENVTVEVFWPGSEIAYYKDYPKSSTQFINNHSLLMKFTYGESTMLFGGDLYSAAEREIIAIYGDRLRSGVLKANHHGDSTSSSKPFREAVSPQITVMISDILTDLNTYQKFRKAGSVVFITHYNGDVKVWTSGDGIYHTLTVQEWEPDFFQ